MVYNDEKMKMFQSAVTLLKEKAFDFEKELGVGNFQAFGGWLEIWKKHTVYTFVNSVLQKTYNAFPSLH